MLGLSDVKTIADLIEKAFSYSSKNKAARTEDFEEHIRAGHKRFLVLARDYLRALKEFGSRVHTCTSDGQLREMIAELEMGRIEIVVDRSEIRAKFLAIHDRLDVPAAEISLESVPTIELQGYIQGILDFFHLAPRMGIVPVTGVTSILEYTEFARSRDVPFEEIRKTCEISVASLQYKLEKRLDLINSDFEKISRDAQTYLNVLQSR